MYLKTTIMKEKMIQIESSDNKEENQKSTSKKLVII